VATTESPGTLENEGILTADEASAKEAVRPGKLTGPRLR
jgi:hypothetical protein